MIRFISQRARRFAADETGSATIEFCIMFPPIIFLFLLGAESGIHMTRNVMFERAVDITVRELRLDKIPRDGFGKVPVDKVKEMICDNALMLPNCKSTILINLQPVSMTTWSLPPEASVDCRDNPDDIVPPTDLLKEPANPHEVMLMRACVLVDPIWAEGGMMAGLKKSKGGKIYLTSISAFVNEPT